MARYRIITLVDITRTQATRSETDQKKISQQANFNSLIQAIGLRANMTWAKDPSMNTGSIPRPFKGKANHWIWEFDTERVDEFLKDDDPVGLLVDDLHGVPIIAYLNDNIDLDPPVFLTKGEDFNTYVEML